MSNNMKHISQVIEEFESGFYDNQLTQLYKDDYKKQKSRYIRALTEFIQHFDSNQVEIYSVPGRSEIGGNHTDHQHGLVLATAISLDTIGIVSKTNKNLIHIISDNYIIETIDIHSLDKKDYEIGTSASLIKGILSYLKQSEYMIGGFNAYLSSDILIGAGLSSSACFEIMIGTIISNLYNDSTIDLLTLSKAGQYAENTYYGKPCGLMDQITCAYGSMIMIDFKKPNDPIIEKINVDFSQFNHTLCIINTQSDHIDLTNEYTSIPDEMKLIANYFHQEYLRDVSEEEFYKHINHLKDTISHRALLRAIHFFEENKRVLLESDALKNNDFDTFKYHYILSSNSSFKYLQNVYSTSNIHDQLLSLCLSLSDVFLKEKGMSRIHGGGFAGTIQVLLPTELAPTYQSFIENIFGKNTCTLLSIRQIGAFHLK